MTRPDPAPAGTPRPEGQAERPRYARLAEALRQRIEDGSFPVGALLPTEVELCEEFGVSRYTVREALRRLTEAGYLQRRQGSGSQVLSARPREAYVHSMRSLDELFQYAASTRFRIARIAEDLPGAAHADDLRNRHDQPWLILEGLRSDAAGSVPICHSIVFVNRDFATVADELRGHAGAIYRLIEERFGVVVATVEQEIRALPMPADAARALGVSRRVWAVRVLRRYLGADGRLLLASVNFHPGDRFFYSMNLRREGPRGGWS